MVRIFQVTHDISEASGVGTFVKGINVSLEAAGADSRVVTRIEDLQPLALNIMTGDIVHIHGLWLGLHHKAAKWSRENVVPIVWSTHGMTAPWSMRHKRWKKIPAWWLYQKRDLQSAAAIHCTTEEEVEWNKSLGLKNCFVAPLGTHLSPFRSPTPTHDSNYTHTLLFVGRIHPVKGLVNLIKAWGLVMKHSAATCSLLPIPLPNWKLRIVGPDEANHLSSLKSEVRSLGLENSVEFPGPKFGEELSNEYANCDCLVLPSFTENFGATIVDAMAHGKPCIASTFTPWKELQDNGCGWWISNEPEALAKAILEMVGAGDEKRRAMGEIGRKLVQAKYTWDAVAAGMIKAYESVMSKV